MEVVNLTKDPSAAGDHLLNKPYNVKILQTLKLQ